MKILFENRKVIMAERSTVLSQYYSVKIPKNIIFNDIKEQSYEIVA